jgi:Nif-specific regulatory protein
VRVNCGALPGNLVESELFGHEKGAFTGADRLRRGRFEIADRGTLFLDEIGELPPAAQAKLLQLLQSGRYHPLGSAQAVQADVRVIAATNVDLEEAVAERRFREDLFYRLQVLPVRLPSLAERSEDVVELARCFCAAASERHGLRKLTLTPGAQRAVEAAEWPGNVRQLAHAIEAAVIRAAGEGAQMLERQHVFPNTETTMNPAQTTPTFQEATRHFQRDLLQRTLEETGWNVTEAARRLDLARSHVYNLIRAFGFQRTRSEAIPES